MKKFVTIAILLLSINAIAQKVEKEYYHNGKLKKEYQVNANGVKNGYYKSYGTNSVLWESSNYKDGEKHGTCTFYFVDNNPGKISQIINYSNGKEHGTNKVWLFEGSKYYLAVESFYENGKEIRKKSYYSNGQTELEIDIEKGIYNKWFKDGKPAIEVVNGKKYSYHETGNGRRYVTSVSSMSSESDTVYSFSEYGLSTIKFSNDNQEFLIDYNSIQNPVVKVKEINSADNFYYIKPKQIDSTYFRISILAYINSPDPNRNKKDIFEYDKQTGNAKIKNADGSYKIIHYYSTANTSYAETEYDKNGKVLISRIVDEDFMKKNNNRPLIVKKYNDGVLIEETDNKNKSTITFYPNGQIESEIYIADKDLNRQHTTYKEFYENGKIKKLSIENTNKQLLSEIEYYESGVIKSEVIMQEKELRPDKKFEYDKDGKIIKITLFAFNPSDNIVVTDKKEIAKHLCEFYTKKFESKYLVVKVVNSSSGYYNTYEYPKGQNIYQRSKKVIDKYNLEINYSTDESNTQKLISELKLFIDKLLEIADSDISDLDLTLKKVKKVEDIKSTILNWK